MKHILSFTLAATLLLCMAGCTTDLKNSTPEKLGESVFLCLKNNDAKGYRSLFPDRSEIDEILTRMTEAGEDVTSEKINSKMDEMDEKIPGEFAQLRAQIADAGIDLGTAKWEGSDVVKMDQQNGIEVVSISLFFRSGDVSGKVSVRNAGKLNRGWLLDLPPRFETVEN